MNEQLDLLIQEKKDAKAQLTAVQKKFSDMKETYRVQSEILQKDIDRLTQAVANWDALINCVKAAMTAGTL